MDNDSAQTLVRLLRSQRVASLGTLRDGAPLVSMVLYAAAPDFSTFYIHVSGLAQHTQAMAQDSRVSLMVAEADDGQRDPQMLARVSIRGEAVAISPDDPTYQDARQSYLAKFPNAAILFGLGDFSLYRIQLQRARYVAGFGKAFNLGPSNFAQVADLDG